MQLNCLWIRMLHRVQCTSLILFIHPYRFGPTTTGTGFDLWRMTGKWALVAVPFRRPPTRPLLSYPIACSFNPSGQASSFIPAGKELAANSDGFIETVLIDPKHPWRPLCIALLPVNDFISSSVEKITTQLLLSAGRVCASAWLMVMGSLVGRNVCRPHE